MVGRKERFSSKGADGYDSGNFASATVGSNGNKVNKWDVKEQG